MVRYLFFFFFFFFAYFFFYYLVFFLFFFFGYSFASNFKGDILQNIVGRFGYKLNFKDRKSTTASLNQLLKDVNGKIDSLCANNIWACPTTE